MGSSTCSSSSCDKKHLFLERRIEILALCVKFNGALYVVDVVLLTMALRNSRVELIAFDLVL